MLVIRPLHRILGAQALSSLGTSISTVALAVMVFDISGSVLHMGGVLAASTAPLMVMSFVGGALLDRYEGRRLMVLSDIARALLVLAMPLAATQSVALIYVVAGVIGWADSRTEHAGEGQFTSERVPGRCRDWWLSGRGCAGGLPWVFYYLHHRRCHVRDFSLAVAGAAESGYRRRESSETVRSVERIPAYPGSHLVFSTAAH